MKKSYQAKQLFTGKRLKMGIGLPLACLLLSCFMTGTVKAQTSVTRTSRAAVAVSPTNDSVWTYRLSDYALVGRMEATTSFPFTINGINSITTSPASGITYCLLNLGLPGNTFLATMNLSNGVCTVLGSLGDNFVSLTVNNNGTLFGLTSNVATNPTTMYKIDPATATTTFFEALPFTGSAQVVAFCADNNTFYEWSGITGIETFSKFDTSGGAPVTVGTSLAANITGAAYIGGGQFTVTDTLNNIYNWDTAGAISAPFGVTAAVSRGLALETFSSTISTSGPTALCPTTPGNNVTPDTLTVTNGTGNYQWYMNGVAISGETNNTYITSNAGEYNVTYTDSTGVTDSAATGITITNLPAPGLPGPYPTSVCNGQTFTYLQSDPAVANYFWGHPATTIGSTTIAENHGTGNIIETLSNPTPDQATIIYADTIVGINGCVNIQNLTVSINPTPTLFPTPLVGNICNGDNFTFNGASLTDTNVTYSWSRVSDAYNSANSGNTNVISETLNNLGSTPLTVTYADTLKAFGCTNVQPVQVIVNPTPALTSTHSASICDSSVFHYLDTTSTAAASTSVTWSRAAVPGILPATNAGSDSINEVLDNTLDVPVVVTYEYTLTAYGSCSNTQTVTVTVNPTPMLHTPLTPAAICDSSLFHYAPDTTAGAMVMWTRAVVAGITPSTANGTNSVINEYLNNTTASPVTVTYHYTLTYGGCAHTENVSVVVNNKPILNAAAVAAITPICDNTAFNFNPGAAAGTTYSWVRPYVLGIGKLPGSGTGSIVNDTLNNNTYVDVVVAYIYTVTANSCSNVQTINVTVRPTPEITRGLTDSICSGAGYTFSPTSLTPDVTDTWTRGTTAGINGTHSGSGNIKDTLVNTTDSNVIVHYTIVLTTDSGVHSCSSNYTLAVTVKPSGAPVMITTAPGNSVCDSSLAQNFGASNAPATGVHYTWTASNATVTATGDNGQYALVDFNMPGNAVVMLNSVAGSGCGGSTSYMVNVSTNTPSNPYVIFTAGHFVCLQNDVQSFQWGYDDATTLDSTMIGGAIDQSYFPDNVDFNNNYYWVMIKTNDGCIKKSYYNKPKSTKNVTDMNSDAGMKVYPNPARETITVENSAAGNGAVTLEVVNALGQKMATIEATGVKTSISLSGMPAGYYIINSFAGKAKIGTAKFIKN